MCLLCVYSVQVGYVKNHYPYKISLKYLFYTLFIASKEMSKNMQFINPKFNIYWINLIYVKNCKKNIVPLLLVIYSGIFQAAQTAESIRI